MDNYYLIIYDWMFHIGIRKKSAIFVYAFIYQMGDNGMFSYKYICDTYRIREDTCETILLRLKQKNLIREEIRNINGSATVFYVANRKRAEAIIRDYNAKRSTRK